MKTNILCIPCMINQVIKIGKELNKDEDSIEKVVFDTMRYISNISMDYSPPHITRNIYRMINIEFETEDPYGKIKEYYNKEMLKLEGDMQRIIDTAVDKFEAALKLAITGNIIDFGGNHHISKEDILNRIQEIENKNLDIDKSKELYNKLKKSKNLLYIGDNCGEIVFDKLFLKNIKKDFPELHIYYGVRGFPIINDITKKDAYDTGIDKYADIIDNGDAAPGTIIEFVSKDFRDKFYGADVIIAKGQGNYETLDNIDRKNVFMLFMAKCDVISKKINVKKMGLVCMEK